MMFSASVFHCNYSSISCNSFISVWFKWQEGSSCYDINTITVSPSLYWAPQLGKSLMFHWASHSLYPSQHAMNQTVCSFLPRRPVLVHHVNRCIHLLCAAKTWVKVLNLAVLPQLHHNLDCFSALPEKGTKTLSQRTYEGAILKLQSIL